MSTKFATNNYKVHLANQLLESISKNDNVYYLFVGDYNNKPNTYVQSIITSDKELFFDTYRNMISGKKVSSNDANLVIRYIQYESNTVYSMYDDSNSSLYDEDFYVITNEGEYFHVYKCLDNNLNSPSTVQPEFSHVSGANTSLYQTSDGYRWKYMYSVDQFTKTKFATNYYFPLIPNTTVSSSATDGSIDVIKIDGVGRGYDNYITGTFNSNNIKYNGNSLLYTLPNDNASIFDGFYTGCLLYISSGTGAGEFRRIVDYVANNDIKTIEIETPFSPLYSPTSGSNFEIYPEVLIVGDGTQINAYARALINSTSSNSVYRVEILENGENYNYVTANVIANSVVSVKSNAIVRPILSPLGGHGSNQANELNASSLCFSVKIIGTEGNTIPSGNKFQQIGLLKDPMYNEINVNYSSIVGNFILNELVYKISPVRVSINANTDSNTNLITTSANNSDFVNQFKQGDFIYLTTQEGSYNQLATISSIVNSNCIEINTNCYFSCTSSYAYIANVSSSGYVNNISNNYVKLSNVSGTFETNSIIIGIDSGACITSNNISINDVIKTTNTFTQLNKTLLTNVTVDYIENEIVYTGSSNNKNSQSLLHSFVNVSTGSVYVYTSNQVGTFVTGDVLYGATSGSTGIINKIYKPELVFGSGEILYVENISSVTRNEDETENFKLIFDF